MQYRVISTPIVHAGVTHDKDTILELSEEEANNIGADLVTPVEPAAEEASTETPSENDGQGSEGAAAEPSTEGTEQQPENSSTVEQATEPAAEEAPSTDNV